MVSQYNEAYVGDFWKCMTIAESFGLFHKYIFFFSVSIEYDAELIDDLEGDCSGFFGTMMHSLATAKRNDDCDDNGDAAEDAQILIGVSEQMYPYG